MSTLNTELDRVYGGYEADEVHVCGVHAAIAEMVQLALEGNDSGLDQFEQYGLHEALDALDYCYRHDCDNHANERHARDALRHAIKRAKAADEQLAQDEADARQHGGACGCETCV